MRRKFLFALLAAALLLFPAVASPLTTATTYGGDCGRAYVRFWSNYNQTGSSAKYCWYGIGGGDSNMRYYDTVPNLGPLYNGGYVFDFNSSDLMSGIKSVTFYNNPSDAYVSNLCVYWSTNFQDPATRFYAGGNYNLIADIGSMRWTTATSLSGC
jgi:hypothetical protein